jgi:hypothetical protein
LLGRLEHAASGDIDIARLTLGLFQGVFGTGPQDLFPGYQGALLDCHRLPKKLQNDVRALVDWALGSPNAQMYAIRVCIRNIESGVRKIRSRSPLGMRFRKRARSLMRLNPQLPKTKWKPFGSVYKLMREEIGRPLTERVVTSALALRPKILQIVPHDAYLNSTWTVGALTIRLNDDGYTVGNITLAVAQSAQTGDPMSRRFEGELVDYFETGAEGVIWMLEDDRRFGRAALELICEGDDLTIIDQLGKVLWRGVVRCDKEIGLRPYPMNPEYSQQCALGHWVHWIQRGFNPDDWARFFIRPDYDRLRGILVRKPGAKRDAHLGPKPQ